MRRKTTALWVIVCACIGTGFVLGRGSFLLTPPRADAALPTAVGSSQGFLPLVHTDADTLPQVEATVAALVAANAQQATQIARYSEFVSYLATQVPARDRAPTVDTLVYQHANLATQVAEVYVALGSPVPTVPPSPTFGPTPIPTRTPFATSTSTTLLPTE